MKPDKKAMKSWIGSSGSYGSGSDKLKRSGKVLISKTKTNIVKGGKVVKTVKTRSKTKLAGG